MNLLELVISAGMLLAAVAFVAWVAYTCGYDRGWADRQDGKPHRDMLSVVGDDERLFYVAAYVLDDIEASEHGGSIWGAWITEKGSRLLAVAKVLVTVPHPMKDAAPHLHQG